MAPKFTAHGIVICFLILCITQTESLRTNVTVPHSKHVGEDAVLECDSINRFGRNLFSVKWFKNDEEFFRYLPKDNPSNYAQEIDGVTVDTAESNETRVVLKSVNLLSSGLYRCEISLDAPGFETSSMAAEMTVTVKGLTMKGLKVPSSVKIGTENLVLDCDYEVNEGNKRLLVVKWYLNRDPTPVYQWTAGRGKPEATGILKGRLNLNYTVSHEPWWKHRALSINKVTPELAGEWTCRVTTFEFDERLSANMTVAESAGTSSLNVTGSLTEEMTKYDPQVQLMVQEVRVLDNIYKELKESNAIRREELELAKANSTSKQASRSM